VPWAAQVVRLRPELSVPPPVSPRLPAAKVEVAPPTREIVPVPVLGVVTPVLLEASGVVELKFQRVISWALAEMAKPAERASAREEFKRFMTTGFFRNGRRH